MNLRPMEVRDNPAVAQLIRASLEEFGLDKPGTVYFDSHLDHWPTIINIKRGRLTLFWKMKAISLAVVALHLCLIRLLNYKKLYVTKKLSWQRLFQSADKADFPRSPPSRL